MALNFSDLNKASPGAFSSLTFKGDLNPGKLSTGSTTSIRFLPVLPEEEPKSILGFLGVRHVHRVGNETVACLKDLGDDDCPVCNASSAFYAKEKKAKQQGRSEEAAEFNAQGKALYRKQQLFANVLVTATDSNEGETIVGKTFALQMTAKSHLGVALSAGVTDEDVEHPVHDLDKGYEFKIKKTMKPGSDFADYSTSRLSTKSTPVPPHLREVAEETAKRGLAGIRFQNIQKLTREELVNLLSYEAGVDPNGGSGSPPTPEASGEHSVPPKKPSSNGFSAGATFS